MLKRQIFYCKRKPTSGISKKITKQELLRAVEILVEGNPKGKNYNLVDVTSKASIYLIEGNYVKEADNYIEIVSETKEGLENIISELELE